MIMVLPVLGDFSFVSSLGVRDAVDQTYLGGMGGVTEEVKKSCYKHRGITMSLEFLKMNLRCVCVCFFIGFRV
jgi:hypothetical protein